MGAKLSVTTTLTKPSSTSPDAAINDFRGALPRGIVNASLRLIATLTGLGSNAFYWHMTVAYALL